MFVLFAIVIVILVNECVPDFTPAPEEDGAAAAAAAADAPEGVALLEVARCL